MHEQQNPYNAPAADRKLELRLKRRRRKFINLALTIGLFVVLFPAYWGIRVLLAALNHWLFG